MAGFADREQADAVCGAALTGVRLAACADQLHGQRVHRRVMARPLARACPSVRVGRFLVVPSWLAPATDPTARSTATPCASGSMPAGRSGPARIRRPGSCWERSSNWSARTPRCSTSAVAAGSWPLRQPNWAARRSSPSTSIPRRTRPRVANVVANGLAGRVSVSLDPLSSVSAMFDVVLANLLASTIETLATELARRGRARRPSSSCRASWPIDGRRPSRAFPAGPCRRSPRRTAGLQSRSHERRDDGVTTSSRPPRYGARQ